MTTAKNTDPAPEELITEGAEFAPEPNLGKSWINVSADTVLHSTAHLPAEQRDLIRWLFSYCKTKGWNWEKSAEETKISVAVLSRIFADKYRYPTFEYKVVDGQKVKVDHPKAGQRIGMVQICERIAKYKRLALERDENSNAPVVMTSTIRSIDQICSEALITKTVAFVYGNNQLGKSLGLERFAANNNHGQSKLYRVPAADSFVAFLKGMAAVCNVSDQGSSDRIGRNIQESIDDTMILLFDEVNLIFQFYKPDNVMKIMEFIREIHDLKKCGVVLCGDNDFRDAFEKGPHTRLLRKLRNRGDLVLQVPDEAPRSDLNLIAASYGLPAIPRRSEVEDIVLLINKESGLGKFTKYLGRAKRNANKKKETFTWDHFHRTWKLAAKMRNGLKVDNSQEDSEENLIEA